MYKWTVTYKDFNDKERTEDFWFHLTEAELAIMNLSYEGGMEYRLNKIIRSDKPSEIIAMFQDILRRSYGVKSDDGRRFIKNDEVFADFEQTEAYSKIFVTLCTDAKRASEFATGIMPKDLAEEAEKAIEEGKIKELPTSVDAPAT